MCSRYTITKDSAEIKRRENIKKFGYVPKYNIAPGSRPPIIIEDEQGFRQIEASWGWKVPWQTSLLINARSETVQEKAVFCSKLHQRCLIPMDSFYECLATPQPIRFLRADEAMFYVAGLWRTTITRPMDMAVTEYSFVLMTTTPNKSVGRFHDRMPFVVDETHFEWWFQSEELYKSVLERPDMTEFNWHPVANAVSNSRNHGAELIRPVPVQRDLL